MYVYVTYVYQSEPTLYSSLNVKELLAWSRREIWSFSDCKWTRTHDHLVYKGTLNRLDKLAKWLSCVVITYLCSAFGCMFLSCNVRVSEWIQARPVWKNGRVFIYELSACGCESSCSHLDFRIPACFEEGVPWHSGNYRVLIHSGTRTWHDFSIVFEPKNMYFVLPSPRWILNLLSTNHSHKLVKNWSSVVWTISS